MRFQLFSLLFVFCFAILPNSGKAQNVEVQFDSIEKMDAAGSSLRQALNAWFAESDRGIPSQWTKLTLEQSDSVQLDIDHHLMLLDSNAAEAQIMAISPEGPKTSTFRPGTNRVLGPIEILLVSSNQNSANIMYRSSKSELAYLSTTLHPESETVEILGLDQTRTIVIVSKNSRAKDFSRIFLTEMVKGKKPEAASKEAFLLVGNAKPKPEFTSYEVEETYVEEEPWSAMITFYVVRGSSSSLKSLTGSVRYENSGNTSDPSISASGGAYGGTIQVGSANDRFSGKLKALERSGSVSVTSESFIRVPLGGRGQFNFQGINGGVDGYVSTRRVGSNQVELFFDQGSGDWSSFGAVSSRLRFRDGQTLEVARSSSSRSSYSRSGPPIIQDIPYIGAGVGSTTSSSSSDSYALFVTVEME